MFEAISLKDFVEGDETDLNFSSLIVENDSKFF